MGLFDWMFAKQDQPPPEDDDEPHDPPTAQRAAARAIALSLVLYRASLEQFPGDRSYERLHGQLPEWIARVGLADELEPPESELLRARLGRADPRAITNASWRADGLAVLAWALGRFELPVYDEMADPCLATTSVGFTEELLAALDTSAAQTVLREAELAPPGVISVFASHTTVVGWRLRQFRLSPGPLDYVDLLRSYPNFKEHWLEHARFSGGDLAIGELPIAEAPADYVSDCEGSADERRIAAYWLQGDHSVYSWVDPSTLLSCA